MGRKKRDMTYMKPFCFYCEKSFRNEVFLHQHQKAKHFTCEKCNKKFSSIDSMLSHSKTLQNHEPTEKVPNAIRGRQSIGLKVFGMQGVPRIQVESWILKGAEKYWGKIVDENLKKRQKQEKQRAQEESKNEKQQVQIKPIIQQKQQEEQVNMGPISFELGK